MRVYKYSSEENVINKSVQKRMLKVSTINELNDPFELMGLELHDSKFRHQFKKERVRFSTEFGVLCFSKSWNNPVLWSHYANKHYGCCLGFDIPDLLIREIVYLPK